MSPLLLVWALGATQGHDWRMVEQTADCKVYVDDGQDTYHGKASCLWTDVTAGKVIGALEDPNNATHFFSNVKVSRVLSSKGNHLKVFQVHDFPVGNDRETYKNVTNVDLGDGLRIEWTLFDEPPDPTEGRVTLEMDTGYWQVRKGASGTEVEFFMAYAPGGFIGLFPAKKAMADGMLRTLTELRAEAQRE